MSQPVPETVQRMLAHRSIRRFTADPVPAEHVAEAVAAGQAASTSNAAQAYCVVQVTRPEVRTELVEVTGGQQRVADCGAFFVVCADLRRLDLACRMSGEAGLDGRLEAFLVATIDASLFAQNMALAFEARGYGICYIGGLRNDLRRVDRLLSLPDLVFPLFGLCVGVPAEDPAVKPRLPQAEVLFTDTVPDDRASRAHLEAHDATYRAYLSARGAAPGGWTERVAPTFSRVRRGYLADYYRDKGARLD